MWARRPTGKAPRLRRIDSVNGPLRAAVYWGEERVVVDEIEERLTEDGTRRSGREARVASRSFPGRLGRRWPALVLLFLLYPIWRLSQPAPALEGEHAAPPPALAGVTLELVADGFREPVHVISPPGDERRLFVVEKAGRIIILKDGVRLERPFLDITSRVSTVNQEEGLLSVAFHPRYAQNRRFFVNFTDRQRATRIIEYRAREDDPDRADLRTSRPILRIPQPWRNHNGGHCLFGPDGYLWIGTGDGGAAGDPQDNAQNPGSLLGKILRIDVDGTDGAPYGSPPSNPLVEVAGARPEVWALGVRNPWRMAFDRETGDLYFADVGQNRYEEVNVVPVPTPAGGAAADPAASGGAGGANFGWDIVEGLGHCYGAADCDQTGLVPPVVEYGHDFGTSITGGHVYRGRALPELRGVYLYGDYVSGRLRSFRLQDGEAVDRWDWTDQLNPGRRIRNIASFGEDAAGEMYLVSHRGPIYRLARRPD